jgi:COMM domain containing 2
MYFQHRKEIRVLLEELSFELPHFDDLNWRLDIQVASRALRGQVNPLFIIELQTLEPGMHSNPTHTCAAANQPLN